MNLLHHFLLLLVLLSSATTARAADDWPTYMHDFERTGMTTAKIALPLVRHWTYIAGQPPQPAWPGPAKQNFWKKQFDLKPRVVFDRAFHVVASDGCVFFGSSAEDSVTCLDAKTGQSKWRFFAEGPVRLSPAMIDGRVYFGSDDGCVYCLRATDGALVWKHREVRKDRRIPGNGRMISTWPVRSDVMVYHNVARFTAGIFPKQGAFQGAVDATTGKPAARTELSFSPQGYLEQRGERVYFASGRAGLAYFAQLKRRGIEPPQGTDKKDKTASRPSTVIGTPALRFVGGLNQVDALDAPSGKRLWSAKVDGQVYSLAIADGRLLVSTDQGKIYCFGDGKFSDAPRENANKPAPFVYRDEAQQAHYRDAAAQILERTGLGNRAGYCLVLGSEDGALAYEIARQSKLRVVGVDHDAARADRTRRRLAASGMYGARVAIHHVGYSELPYGDHLFNLVVSDTAMASGKLPGNVAEVMRVLRPSGGALCIGTPDSSKLAGVGAWFESYADAAMTTTEGGNWTTLRSKPLAKTGEWTHLYGNASNTMASGDQLVGNNLALQWFGRPGPRLMVDRHLRAMAPLAKNGRLFVPGDDHLFAVDAYNGAPLWQRAIKGTRRVSIGRDTGTMALADDTLYVVSRTKCQFIEVDTGKTRVEVAPLAATDGKPRDWGYVAVDGQSLIGTATQPGASRRVMSREVILDGYKDHRAVVTSQYVFCVDRRTGKASWPGRTQQSTGAILNPTLTIGAGKLYYVASADAKSLEIPSGRAPLRQLLASGAELVAVDLASGSVAWRRALDLNKVEHDLYLALVDGRLVLNGSGNIPGPPDKKGKPTKKLQYYFWAFDAGTGRDLWQRSELMPLATNGEHGEQNRRCVLMNQTVYLAPWAFALATGEPIVDWKQSAKRRGCGAVTASASTFFFRDDTCSSLDIKSRRALDVTAVTRPGCWVNMIPASGLLLVPEASSGCVCKHAVQASMAFGPKRRD